MKQIEISWNTGNMTINCDNFFPATQLRMSRLVRIIERDCFDQERIYTEILDFIDDKYKATFQEGQDINTKYLNTRQSIADTQRALVSGRHPNGVLLTDNEIKEFTAELRRLNLLAADMKHRVDKLEQAVKRLDNNRKAVGRYYDPNNI